MTWVAAAIAGTALTYKIYSSETQKAEAKEGLAELNKQPMPEYGVSPELQNAYSRAQAMSQSGYTADETAAFNQNLARSQATQFQAAKDVGGGQFSATLNRMNNVGSIDALNEFAVKNAQLKRSNIAEANNLASQIQNQRNLDAGAKIARRQMLEQAYGAAIRNQTENTNNAVAGGATEAQAIDWSKAGGRKQEDDGSGVNTDDNFDVNNPKDNYR